MLNFNPKKNAVKVVSSDDVRRSVSVSTPQPSVKYVRKKSVFRLFLEWAATQAKLNINA